MLSIEDRQYVADAMGRYLDGVFQEAEAIFREGASIGWPERIDGVRTVALEWARQTMGVMDRLDDYAKESAMAVMQRVVEVRLESWVKGATG